MKIESFCILEQFLKHPFFLMKPACLWLSYSILCRFSSYYLACLTQTLRLFEFQDPYSMTLINLIRFLNLRMMLHQSSTLLLKMLLLSKFLLSMLLFSTLLPSMLIMAIWVVEFSNGDTKLERFLLKNQHSQRKLLNFENWCTGCLILKWIKWFVSERY